MGKGIITSNEGEGLYLIDYIYNTAALNEKIAQLKRRITEIDTVEIPVMEAAIIAKEVELTTVIGNINSAIATEAPEEQIIELTTRRNEASASLDRLESTLAAKKGEALSVSHQITDIEAKRIDSKSVSAWCADYNLNLAVGLEVGVMEFPGEAPGVSQPVIIRPAGSDGTEAAFENSDGIMTQSIAMTPEQLYYNMGLFPAWQRWNPIYRLGTLGLVDKETDKCIVFMDNNSSSYQGLDTIPEGNTTLTDIPIEYMDSNAATFETGDRVVVQMNPATPETIKNHGTYSGTIIGYESNPKLAGSRYWRYTITGVHGSGMVDVSDEIRTLVISEIEAYDYSTGISPEHGVINKVSGRFFYNREHTDIAEVTVSAGANPENLIDDDITVACNAGTTIPWSVELDFGTEDLGEGPVDKIVNLEWVTIGIDLASTYWVNPEHTAYAQIWGLDLAIEYKVGENWVTKKTFEPIEDFFGIFSNSIYNFRALLD